MQALPGIGTALSVAGAAAFATQALATADEIDNLTKQVDLSAEAVQALKFVTEEAGVSFDTMRPAINQMRRALEAANTGSREMQAAFADLGITLEEVQSLSTEEVLDRVAQAMARGTGSADVAAASTRVLGAEATRLRGIMQQLGDEGLQNVINRLDEMNLIIDGKTISALDRQEEAFSRAGVSIKNFTVEALGGAVGFVEDVGIALGALTSDTKNFVEVYAKAREDLKGEGPLLEPDDLGEAPSNPSEEVDAEGKKKEFWNDRIMESIERQNEFEKRRDRSRMETAEQILAINKEIDELHQSPPKSGEEEFKWLEKIRKLRNELDVAMFKQGQEEEQIRKEKWREKERELENEKKLKALKQEVNSDNFGRLDSRDNGFTGQTRWERLGMFSGAKTKEDNQRQNIEKLTRRQLDILERSQQTLERIEQREGGAVL